MHKLVIIDDEYEHVHGIANYIDWAKYDIEVCGVAYNGKEGLEVIKTRTRILHWWISRCPILTVLT